MITTFLDGLASVLEAALKVLVSVFVQRLFSHLGLIGGSTAMSVSFSSLISTKPVFSTISILVRVNCGQKCLAMNFYEFRI